MDATQTELLESARKNAVMDVRVSMPARVVSFDASAKTVSVEIGLTMVGQDDEDISYPPLVDCPCVFSRGGGFHVVHPYKEGDKGVVLFSDRCLDGWFESGRIGQPLDYRIHSMSDAYFIGGADCLDDVSPIIDNAIFIGKDDNSSGLQINSDGSLILKGTSLHIVPPVTADSTINAKGQITANGKHLDGHSHGGVDRGSSNTDPL